MRKRDELRWAWVPVDELQEHPRNPRTINESAFDRLRRHLDADPEMLQLRPLIAVNGHSTLPDGTVIAGNMRLRAAKALGWALVPAFVGPMESALAFQRMIRDNVGYGEWEELSLGEELSSFRDEHGNDELELIGLEGAYVDRLIDGRSGFDPPADATPPRLDERSVVTCPHCGKEFTR